MRTDTISYFCTVEVAHVGHNINALTKKVSSATPKLNSINIAKRRKWPYARVILAKSIFNKGVALFRDYSIYKVKRSLWAKRSSRSINESKSSFSYMNVTATALQFVVKFQKPIKNFQNLRKTSFVYVYWYHWYSSTCLHKCQVSQSACWHKVLIW